MRSVIYRALHDSASWVERTRDVSFLLDSLDDLERAAAWPAGRLDRSRTGVGGHSLGAFTAQLIGGATIPMPGEASPRSFADPRARAVLLLSGQGAGLCGLSERSWEAMRLPVMAVTGSRDQGSAGDPPEWRLDPYRHSPPGDKYGLFIDGARHMTFTGLLGSGGSLLARWFAGARRAEEDAIFGWVKRATQAFWDAALKDDAAAGDWLRSGELLKASGGKARLEHR